MPRSTGPGELDRVSSRGVLLAGRVLRERLRESVGCVAVCAGDRRVAGARSELSGPRLRVALSMRQGIPFIALEGEGKDSKFRLTDEAKEFLQTLKVIRADRVPPGGLPQECR